MSQFGGDFNGFRQDGGSSRMPLPGSRWRSRTCASYSSLDLTSTSEVEGKATLTGSLDGGDTGYRFGFGGSLEY